MAFIAGVFCQAFMYGLFEQLMNMQPTGCFFNIYGKRKVNESISTKPCKRPRKRPEPS